MADLIESMNAAECEEIAKQEQNKNRLEKRVSWSTMRQGKVQSRNTTTRQALYINIFQTYNRFC